MAAWTQAGRHLLLRQRPPGSTYPRNAQAFADRILGSVIQGVQKFRGSAKQEDDITLAVIKVVG